MGRQLPGQEDVAVGPEGQQGRHRGHHGQQPHPSVMAPSHQAPDHHGHRTEPEILRGQDRPLAPAHHPAHGGPEEPGGQGRGGQYELLGHRASIGRVEVRPHQTAQVGWAGQGEPHRIGQQDPAGDRGRSEAHDGVVETLVQVGRMPPGGPDRHHGDPDDHHDGHDDEDLAPDEELHRHQQAQDHAGQDGRARSSEQQLVQAQNDQGRHHRHPQHEVGVGQAHQDEGREAVEQTGEEGRRRPGHPPTHQDEHGQGRQGRGQGQGHVHRGDGPEQPRDRGKDHADGQDAGIGRQVDPPGVAGGGRVEGIEAVGYGVGRPFDEPGEQGAVTTAAGGGGGGVPGPHVPPQHHGQGQIARSRQEQRP